MKRHDIPKNCADTLRSYLNDTYGIKLKSGHAHEIVAACFGYKSPIAMLGDTEYSISNLERSKFIVFDPPTSLVEQRLKKLEGLPPNLPPSTFLVQQIYSVLKDNLPMEIIYPDFHELAFALAEDRLIREMKQFGMNAKSFNWIKETVIEKSETEVVATVHFGYHTSSGETHRHRKYDIQLPRLAANLGYGEPKVEETSYSGLTRTKSDEELDKMYPTRLYPAGTKRL